MEPIKTRVKALAVAEAGAGKTFFAGSFPKSYWIQTEPGGFETIEMNPELLKNTVKHQYFLPSPVYALENVFKDIEEAVKEAHELAKEGKVETLILDNITYFALNRWLYIEKHGKIFTKEGELNKLAMYADLADYLYEFTYWYLASFPGNVVVTCHEKQEAEQALKKKLDKSLSKVPDIAGSFRDRCYGLFSLVIYLDKRIDQGQYVYSAQTNKGNGRLAKNRYGLNNIEKNISYQTLLDKINAAKNEVKHV